MADPKVKVTVVADGKRKDGVLTPSAGATIELLVADAAKARFGIDYTKADELSLRVGGDVEKRFGAKGRIRAEGDLEKSLLDGTVSFDGTLTMQFSKDVAVKVDTALDDSKQQVGLKLTLAFE